MTFNIFRFFRGRQSSDSSSADSGFSNYIMPCNQSQSDGTEDSLEKEGFCTNIGMMNLNIYR